MSFSLKVDICLEIDAVSRRIFGNKNNNRLVSTIKIMTILKFEILKLCYLVERKITGTHV